MNMSENARKLAALQQLNKKWLSQAKAPDSIFDQCKLIAIRKGEYIIDRNVYHVYTYRDRNFEIRYSTWPGIVDPSNQRIPCYHLIVYYSKTKVYDCVFDVFKLNLSANNFIAYHGEWIVEVNTIYDTIKIGMDEAMNEILEGQLKILADAMLVDYDGNPI